MPDDMLTTNDVARMVGVTRKTLDTYIARGSFPRPDGYLGTTRWWKPETVARYLAEERGTRGPARGWKKSAGRKEQ